VINTTGKHNYLHGVWLDDGEIIVVSEYSNRNKKIAVILTGSSSGIGFETSLLLARNGFFTYATMRNLEKSKAIIDLK
jgi:hypothetical protein